MLTNRKLPKIPVLSTALAISTLGFGLVYSTPEAKAFSIVPTTEGEVKLSNVSCLGGSVPCLDPTDQATTGLDFGYTVESLPYDFDNDSKQFGLSRLFADQQQTANDWGFGIEFLSRDEGTNPGFGEYWFRPVAYNGDAPDALPTTGNVAENGRLEVGRFKFNFDKPMTKVRLDFFDVEKAGFSGVLEVNGQSVKDLLLPAGPNDGLQSLFLDNVTSLVLQLGNPGPFSDLGDRGDGVLLADFNVQPDDTEKVPEPGMTAGLAALTLAGALSLLRRKRVSAQS